MNAHRIRRALERRDGTDCSICGKPMWVNDRTIDHIKRKKDGGSNALENLRLAHERCNRERELNSLPSAKRIGQPGDPDRFEELAR